MRAISILVLAVTACTATGGFSWTAGGTTGGGTTGGGTGGAGSPSSPATSHPPARSHAVVSEETRAAIAAAGHPFDVNRDCYGDHPGIDYHRDPIVYWPCFDFAERPGSAEYSTFARDCDELAAAFGADGAIACRIEHRGFDAHFAAHAAIPRQRDRDGSDPGNACDMILAELDGRHAGAANTLGMLTKPAVRAEFLAKVKTVTCAYDDQRGGTVELAGTDLRFYTKQRVGEGWVLDELLRTGAFPALDAYVQEYGACITGYSC